LTTGLSIMGVACLVNAMRCGRVHCYITGPFFLAMAAATLLYGLGVLPLGGSGWNLIGLTVLAGAVALCCLPKMCSSGNIGRTSQAKTNRPKRDADHVPP
jgi:hypothetical protein